MKYFPYDQVILDLVAFTRERLEDDTMSYFRKNSSKQSFLKEFATVRVGGPRRSGHTTAAMSLEKSSVIAADCIVPYRSVQANWQLHDSYPSTLDDFVELADSGRRYHGRLIIVDCATVAKDKIDRLYDALAKYKSVPDDLVIVLLQ